MQTDSFTILVRSDKYAYKIPQGQLTMLRFQAHVFRFIFGIHQRVIKLPKEYHHVFGDFYQWMHLSKAYIDFSKGAEATFELVIFAERVRLVNTPNIIVHTPIVITHTPGPKQ